MSGPRADTPAPARSCHAMAEIALLRALTEAVQVRNTYVTGSRDDLRAEEYVPSERAGDCAISRQSMASSGPARNFSAVPSHGFETFDEGVPVAARSAGCGGMSRACWPSI